MLESATSSESSFRVKSTPSACYDQVECVAEDMVLSLSGSEFISIRSVTGNFNIFLEPQGQI